MEGAANRRMTIAMQNAEGALQKVRLDERSSGQRIRLKLRPVLKRSHGPSLSKMRLCRTLRSVQIVKYGKHLADLAPEDGGSL